MSRCVRCDCENCGKRRESISRAIAHVAGAVRLMANHRTFQALEAVDAALATIREVCDQEIARALAEPERYI